MSRHARYADWDGAYVMGALSRSERLEFEEHLIECRECSEAVADLGALPGLLGRLNREDAETLLRAPVADPPDDLASRSLSAVPLPWWRRGVLRSARTRAGLAVAAAAVVATSVAVPLAVHHDDATPAPTVAVALQQTRPSPLTAQVSLTSARWGTRIDMTCAYAHTPGRYWVRPYTLYVVGRDGHARLVSSWRAGPGDVTRTTGSTDLAVNEIAALELRSGGGAVLLRSDL